MPKLAPQKIHTNKLNNVRKGKEKSIHFIRLKLLQHHMILEHLHTNETTWPLLIFHAQQH